MKFHVVCTTTIRYFKRDIITKRYTNEEVSYSFLVLSDACICVGVEYAHT